MGLQEVVGLGEHAHGELLSWKRRLALVKSWVREGAKVLVLCENLDYYVQGLRDEGARLRFEFEDVRVNGVEHTVFTPNLMAYADRTHEHLEMTRAFASLGGGGVTFYGVDVQLLDHPHLVSRTRTSALKDAVMLHRPAWERCSHTDRRGAERNRLNAETILRMARMHPLHKVIYFAHNEHVAFGCAQTRRDPTYVTEGAILKRRLGPLYTAVATFAPVTWSVLWRAPERSGRPGPLQTRIRDRHMEYCGRADFDEVLSDDRSRRLRILPPRFRGRNPR
jgi:hypothetical protein